MAATGKGSIQKIWDFLADPDKGLSVKLARIEQNVSGICRLLDEHTATIKRLEEYRLTITGARLFLRRALAALVNIAVALAAILGLKGAGWF